MLRKILISSTFLAILTRANPVVDTNGPTQQNGEAAIKEDDSIYNQVIFSSNHTITSLIVKLSVENGTSAAEREKINLYFNEVDIKTDGTQEVLGQYVYTRGENGKDGVVEKIFSGNCFSVNATDIFFGASDGLYVLDRKTNKTEHLDYITDNVKEVHVSKKTKYVFYLSQPDNKMYKLDLDRKNKIEIDRISSAKSFFLDINDNIYFNDEDKALRVYKSKTDEIIKFSAINLENSALPVRAYAEHETDGVEAFLDGKLYKLYPNGTAEASRNVELDRNVTSVSWEIPILFYYAENGDIYEMNIVALVLQAALGRVAEWMRSLFNRSS